MDNDKHLINTSKMLSFNRNRVHHHEDTLKGLSFDGHVLIETHPFRVGIMDVGKVFLLKDNHFVIFIWNFDLLFSIDRISASKLLNRLRDIYKELKKKK